LVNVDKQAAALPKSTTATAPTTPTMPTASTAATAVRDDTDRSAQVPAENESTA
jgi:hypothetical protein